MSDTGPQTETQTDAAGRPRRLPLTVLESFRQRVSPTDRWSADDREAVMEELFPEGPQRRDYDHGAHGGMQGYWDLRRGPRTRNHCVECHDVHSPAFGAFRPMPAPRDRFTHREAGHD